MEHRVEAQKKVSMKNPSEAWDHDIERILKGGDRTGNGTMPEPEDKRLFMHNCWALRLKRNSCSPGFS